MNNYDDIVNEITVNYLNENQESSFKYARCVGFLQAALSQVLIHLEVSYPEAYVSVVNELKRLKTNEVK